MMSSSLRGRGCSLWLPRAARKRQDRRRPRSKISSDRGVGQARKRLTSGDIIGCGTEAHGLDAARRWVPGHAVIEGEICTWAGHLRQTMVAKFASLGNTCVLAIRGPGPYGRKRGEPRPEVGGVEP